MISQTDNTKNVAESNHLESVSITALTEEYFLINESANGCSKTP